MQGHMPPPLGLEELEARIAPDLLVGVDVETNTSVAIDLTGGTVAVEVVNDTDVAIDLSGVDDATVVVEVENETEVDIDVNN